MNYNIKLNTAEEVVQFMNNSGRKPTSIYYGKDPESEGYNAYKIMS